jgi:hypothetical protein
MKVIDTTEDHEMPDGKETEKVDMLGDQMVGAET